MISEMLINRGKDKKNLKISPRICIQRSTERRINLVSTSAFKAQKIALLRRRNAFGAVARITRIFFRAEGESIGEWRVLRNERVIFMSNNQRAREAMRCARFGTIHSRTTTPSGSKILSGPSDDEAGKSYCFWRDPPVRDAKNNLMHKLVISALFCPKGMTHKRVC